MIDISSKNLNVYLSTVDDLRKQLRLYIDCVEKYVFEGSKQEEERLKGLLDELDEIEKSNVEPDEEVTK